jgi:hypothetical protein
VGVKKSDRFPPLAPQEPDPGFTAWAEFGTVAMLVIWAAVALLCAGSALAWFTLWSFVE